MDEVKKQGGWIGLYRSIKENWIFENPEYLKAWITILLDVNHSKQKKLIKGKMIICERGQSIKSVGSWAKTFGWTEKRVRTFFNRLILDGMIEREPVYGVTTRLSVCNYDTYQNERQRKIKVESIVGGEKDGIKKEDGGEKPPIKKAPSIGIKKEDGSYIKPIDIIQRWNKLAKANGFSYVRENNQKIKTSIGARMKIFKTPQEWNDLFQAIKKRAKDYSKEGWFKLEFVVRNDENFDKVVDDFMAWKYEKQGSSKFNDDIDVQQEIEDWGGFDEE